MIAHDAARFLLFASVTVACGCSTTTPAPAEPTQPGPPVAPHPPAPAASTASSASPVSLAPSSGTSLLAGEPTLRCAMSGRAELTQNTPLLDAQGHAIARFTGAPVLLAVHALTLGENPRAEIETGGARGSFRLRGLLETPKLPLFTTENVPVAAGHLLIAAHRGVSVTATSPDKLKIQHPAAPPLAQSLSTWTTCAALAVDPGTPSGWSPPGDARGFALRKDALELFDAPSGSAVGVLHKAPSAGAVLFFSGEQSGAWVHVERHTDVIVDAWAKASDLSALPRGELLDEPLPPTSTRGAARLALATEPRSIRTTRDVPLRAHAKDDAALIGSIAPDTETYVVEIMAGWVSVLPKTLEIMQPDGGALWAKASELGL
jgi:hypothetical protein